MLSFFRNFTISMRLHTVSLMALLGLLALGYISIHLLEETMRSDIAIKTQQVVDTAYSTVEHYNKLAKAGTLTEDEAKAQAISVLRDMRYNEKEYFWINDFKPAMVMHPIKPELDGKDLSSFADPNGKKIFVEFAKIGQAGGGQVDYLWPKPGSDKPQPKISYVRGFAPWGWVIGSGVYVDDIEAAIWGHAKTLIAICAGIVLLVMIANTLLGRSISLPIKSAIGVMKDIAEDRLNVTIKNTERQNEIGLIARMAAPSATKVCA